MKTVFSSLDDFRKGLCFIFCEKCKQNTLHELLKDKRNTHIAKIDGKTVSFKAKYKCKECATVVTFQRKTI